MSRDIGFRAEILVHGAVVVQMLLVEVQEESDVGRYFGMGELVAGHLEDDDRIVCDLAVVVESGKADVAHEKGRPVCALAQDAVEQRGRGALALGAGHSYDLPGKLGQEEVRHGCVFVAQIPGDDAGTLDNVVIGVLVDLFAFSLENCELFHIAVFIYELFS